MRVIVSTADWGVAIGALSTFASLLRTADFDRGEHFEYATGIEAFRDDIVPILKERLAGREVSLVLTGTAVRRGGMEFVVATGGVRIEVLTIFLDTFTPGLCRGSATTYMRERINSSRDAIRRLQFT